jgi:hypothetical protein
MYIEIMRTGEAATDVTCPKELAFGNNYWERTAVQQRFDGQELISTRLFCPVKKLAAPIDCAVFSESFADQNQAGWAYCENRTTEENTEYTCTDGVDNDLDGFADCDDSECEPCMMCGNPQGGCDLGCKYDIVMTSTAVNASNGNNLFLECPFR